MDFQVFFSVIFGFRALRGLACDSQEHVNSQSLIIGSICSGRLGFSIYALPKEHFIRRFWLSFLLISFFHLIFLLLVSGVTSVLLDKAQALSIFSDRTY